MNKFLNEMVNKGILADKELFVIELKNHNLVINKEMVEAIGYDGETEFVSIDTEDMFVCCTCSRYCTSAYKGQCDKCNRCRCARCARGDPRHPCVTEVEDDSSSESDLLQANTERSEMHFYEIDVNVHLSSTNTGISNGNVHSPGMPYLPKANVHDVHEKYPFIKQNTDEKFNRAIKELDTAITNLEAHGTKPIGFTQQAPRFYTMPCSFKK